MNGALRQPSRYECVPGTAAWARVHLATLVLAGAMAAGCSFASAGRAGARGAVLGLQDQRDSLALVTGQLMDTVTSRIARTLRDSLRPELARLTAQATDTAAVILQTRTGEMQDRLAAYVAGALRDSSGRLVAGLTHLARDSLQRALRIWIRESATGAQEQFTPVIGALADEALSHAMISLDASLKGPLRATILDLVSAAADSVRNKAERTSTSVTAGILDRIRALGAQILVPTALVLLAAAGFTYWQFRKRQRILEVITTEIHAAGSEALKQRIKARAQENRVESDLNDYLKRRNLA